MPETANPSCHSCDSFRRLGISGVTPPVVHLYSFAQSHSLSHRLIVTTFAPNRPQHLSVSRLDSHPVQLSTTHHSPLTNQPLHHSTTPNMPSIAQFPPARVFLKTPPSPISTTRRTAMTGSTPLSPRFTTATSNTSPSVAQFASQAMKSTNTTPSRPSRMS